MLAATWTVQAAETAVLTVFTHTFPGWQATLDRYRHAYPDRAAMGTLSFELRDVRVLSPQWAVVFGAWALDRAEDRPSGLFTLLFEKGPDGWRIVHDHTSTATP